MISSTKDICVIFSKAIEGCQGTELSVAVATTLFDTLLLT